MGYDELSARIRQDYDSEIAAIRLEQAQKVKEIEGATLSDAEKRQSDIIADAQRKALIKRQRMVGEERSKNLMEISQEKVKAADEVLSEAKKRILDLPDDVKSRLLKALANDAMAVPGRKKLKVDQKYAKLIRSFEGVDVVSEDLGEFGIIMESEDGLMRVDNRLSSVLESKKQALKPRINEILFG